MDGADRNTPRDPWDELDAIAALPDDPRVITRGGKSVSIPSERQAALDDFLARYRRLSDNISRRLVQRYGSGQNARFYDDVAAEVYQAMWKMATGVIDGTDTSALHTRANGLPFTSELYSRGRQVAIRVIPRLRSHTDRGAQMSYRRQVEINRTMRILYQETGREPSRSEIIESTNRRMTELWKDAHRKGILVSERDFMEQPVSLDDENNFITPIATDSFLVHPDESAELVMKIVGHCESISPSVGRAARAWVEAVHVRGETNEKKIVVAIVNAVENTDWKIAVQPVVELGMRYLSVVKSVAAHVVGEMWDERCSNG